MASDGRRQVGIGSPSSEADPRAGRGRERPVDTLRTLWREWTGLWGRDEDRFTIVVLVSSLVLVLVFTLWGKSSFLVRHLDAATDLVGWSPGHPYAPMLPYLYWALTSVVLRVLVPLAIIVLVLRSRPSEFGYRIRGVTSHAWLYVLLFVGMVPILVAASFLPSFQAKYPMYFNAAGGWTHFTLYELSYGIQFVGVEAFFRGFLTFGLYPRFGYLSLFIMVIPYAMVHLGKPPLEVFMAIPAGLLLGYLALKTRSWLWTRWR